MPKKQLQTPEQSLSTFYRSIFLTIVGDFLIILSILLPIIQSGDFYYLFYLILPILIILSDSLTFLPLKHKILRITHLIGVGVNIINFSIFHRDSYLDLTEDNANYSVSYILITIGLLSSLLFHFSAIRHRKRGFSYKDLGIVELDDIDANQVMGYIRIHKKIDFQIAESQFHIPRSRLENIIYSLVGEGKMSGKFLDGCFIIESDINIFVDELSKSFNEWDYTEKADKI